MNMGARLTIKVALACFLFFCVTLRKAFPSILLTLHDMQSIELCSIPSARIFRKLHYMYFENFFVVRNHFYYFSQTLCCQFAGCF